MGNEAAYPIQSVNPGIRVISGSFAPNGNGVIDATTVKGKAGFTVARTALGEYTVTLKNRYVGLLSAVLTPQLNALADTDLQLGPVVLTPTTSTIIIRAKTAGVAADIAANANNRVHFEFRLQNQTLPGF